MIPLALEWWRGRRQGREDAAFAGGATTGVNGTDSATTAPGPAARLLTAGIQGFVNRFRPELHVTAETGVLEAPAGAVRQGDALHVFHQFRPTPDSGARWAHQMATGLPYGWDVCDDVLAPEARRDRLPGRSSVLVGDGTVELFFVTTTPTDGEAVRGSDLPHGRRGPRDFRIQRARISDLAAISDDRPDDPSVVRREVDRLGPVEIDDSAHPVTALATRASSGTTTAG